jgi:IPT/TIG domain
MPVIKMTTPDVREFRPTLVLELRDAFSDSNVLQQDVTVSIGKNSPLFQKENEATFVFTNLAHGKYSANVTSASDEQPYYLPMDIPLTLPQAGPANSPWPQPWPGYPNVTLADPTLMLDDPGQSAAYLAQRELTALRPTTAYPFPAGTTLVRGQITANGGAMKGAFVTLALIAQTGQFPVTVVNPDGSTSAATNLNVVTTPVADALSPNAVVAGSPAFTLTVLGTGFVSRAVVRLAGVALATTFLSNSAVAADVPKAAVANAGQFAVIVANPDGSLSNQLMLTVANAPAVNTISPSSVTAGSAAFTLAVQGSGFANNASVQSQGVPLATEFVNSTQLTAQVPAAQIALAGQLNVTVVNPGPPPQVSNALALSVVNAPVIFALQPQVVLTGSVDFVLDVTGTGYVAGSVVKLNGAALPTTYGGATQLTATVSAADVNAAGNLNITVANPNASSAAKVLQVVAGPSITSIDPTSVTAGSTAFTLVVKGTGFVSGAQVELSGTPLATSYISGSELHAHVPRSGYTTGADGTFVLYFDDDEYDAIQGQSQKVTLIVTQQGSPKQTKQDVTVLRGATVSTNIDIT